MANIENEVQTTFPSAYLKAAVNIRFTSNWLSGIQNSHMARYDLTMPQFNILRILRGAKKAITVNAIKERMIEKSPNTTRLMDKLIDKDLIQRKRCDEDRRVVFVEITDAGKELLLKIDQDFKEFELIPESLSEEEALMLSELLDKLRSNYGKKIR